MKGRIQKLLACAFGIAAVTATPAALAQALPPILGPVATTVLADQLRGTANEIVDNAAARGDYLLGMAGIQLRLAIANLEDAANRQRAATFEQLDKASQETFARIRLTLDQIQRGALDGAAAVQQIADSTAQVASILDKNGYRTYLLRYSPSVTYPGDKGPLIVLLRGVNLDQGGASLGLHNGPLLARVLGKQDVAFEIPRGAISYDEKVGKVLTLPLTYQSVKPGFWNGLFARTESVRRELMILALPSAMGTYRLQTSVSNATRKTVQEDYVLPKFQGTHVDHARAVAPPAGWQIDVSTLELSAVNGVQGQCKGFDESKKFPQGIVVLAHTGKEGSSMSRPLGGPGWVNCRLRYVRYQDEATVAPGPSQEGTLAWTSDAEIPLPPAVNDFTLSVTSFRNVTKLFRADGAGDYYAVERSGNRLIVRPQPPADLASR